MVLQSSNPAGALLAIVASLAVVAAAGVCEAAESSRAERFEQNIQPLLSEHCYDCHGYGAAEGGVTLDQDPASEQFLGDHRLWWKVLANVRAGVMPPDGLAGPDPSERETLASWIKSEVFEINPEQIDPGPASVRRLSRSEYRNTIRDLMGIDYDVEINFPPDDSGFGFDNVGEAHALSPMLVEKYLSAAQAIVAEAVPTAAKLPLRNVLPGRKFGNSQPKRTGPLLSFEVAGELSQTVSLKEAGEYEFVLDCLITGSPDVHPGRCRVTFLIDDLVQSDEEYGWAERVVVEGRFRLELPAGEHRMVFRLEPLGSPENRTEEETETPSDVSTRADYLVQSVKVIGPLDPSRWEAAPRYGRFFSRPTPPEEAAEQREYAAELLGQFARRAFRRPVDADTIDRLTAIAEQVYGRSNKTFEEGIAHAMTAVLASPRFLLRADFPGTDGGDDSYPRVDEHSLAARLSYFFWSSMPDETLRELADRGELRSQLDQQVARMLADPRAEALVQNFAGQWLRARDVEHVTVDPLAARGLRDQWEETVAQIRKRRREKRKAAAAGNELVDEEAYKLVQQRFDELLKVRESFNQQIRRAMRKETEETFAYIVRENRPALELIDSDYTFLNDALANFYGIGGVVGDKMRRVTLPADSPRGGVLTQGVMLTVTSNPTRTSPVKRGLYILDNLLGTPPPPPPPDIPELESAAEQVENEAPTLRELLAIHREAPLCASCHNRMDPLGLALENFNALGQWRELENGQPIDPAGELVTGESFQGIAELKQIIATAQRRNYYRCLTEKLFTYALGRGLDYYDVESVDEIVDDLDRNEGRIQTVLKGIVHAAPFDRMRRPNPIATATQDSQRSLIGLSATKRSY